MNRIQRRFVLDELVVKFSGIDEIEEIWFEKAWA